MPPKNESVEATLARMDERLANIQEDIAEIKTNNGSIWKQIRELRNRDAYIAGGAATGLVALGIIQWLLNR